MTYVDLLRFNPWWEHKKAIENDPNIVEFNSEKIKHLPSLTVEQGIYVMRGPRQVGKTTFVKLKIRELLEKTSPENIFYYSFDVSRATEQIRDTVLEYLEMHPNNEKRWLFLDEVTGIADWANAIKLLRDRGDLKKEDVVLVTGSSSIDLKKGSERLPGRGIEGNEFYYLPLSFREYLILKGMEIETANLLDSKKLFKTAKENIAKILTLNKEFRSYLNHGGFLYSINHGKTELTLERYARWLEGDFVKWGKNPLIIKEILQAIIKKKCSQFSYHSIVKETSVSTHNTIIDYLEMAGEELFLKTVNKITLPFKVDRKKEKKAFFMDPLLTSVAEHWAGEKLHEPCLVEHVVMSNLARISSVYFYNDGRKEIDCVMRIKNKTLGIEVKWSDNIKTDDTYAVKKTDVPYILSKETLKIENQVPVIPVSLFLAMLDAKEIIKRNPLMLN